MMEQFKKYLLEDGKSENTIKGYIQSVNGYLKWLNETKGVQFKKLHRENVQEYSSYLKTVKEAQAKTINTKLNGLVKFNEFLVESGLQDEMVIMKKDFQKVQQQYASLAKIELQDVEKFRQLVLDNDSKRNYTIITLLAYTGLRISEALDIKMNHFNLTTREISVIDGKGAKSRTVLMNTKVVEAVNGYQKERHSDSEFLFVSKRGGKLDRTTVNRIFNTYSKIIGKNITPHDLRHFFCSHAINSGLDVHEVANLAGHSNIHTTLLYTNPTKKQMIDKIDKL